MTKPRTLGYLAVHLTEAAGDQIGENQSQLRDNQKELFDVVAAIYAGDKRLAISLLQKISDRNTQIIDRNATVVRALALMQSQDLHAAAEALGELISSEPQLLDKPFSNPNLSPKGSRK